MWAKTVGILELLNSPASILYFDLSLYFGRRQLLSASPLGVTVRGAVSLEGVCHFVASLVLILYFGQEEEEGEDCTMGRFELREKSSQRRCTLLALHTGTKCGRLLYHFWTLVDMSVDAILQHSFC